MKNGESAYYINELLSVNHGSYWSEDNLSDYFPCKNKALVEERAKQERLGRLLWKFAHENNAVPTEEEIKNINFPKWHIVKDVYIGSYKSIYYDYIFTLNSPLFNSRESCQRAIDEIVVPFMNGEI